MAKKHWTQKPENATRVRRMLRKAQRARLANRSQLPAPAPARGSARLLLLARLGADAEITRLEAEIATLRAFIRAGQ